MTRVLLVPFALLLPLGGCACTETTPSELRPLIEAMVLLPSLAECSIATQDTDCGAGNPCNRVVGAIRVCQDPTPQASQNFSVRNLGDKPVAIESVTFTGTDAAAFTEAQTDIAELFKDDVAAVRFVYFTADIFAALSATMVITSDAEANPSLEVPVSTVPFDDGGEGEGEGEGE